MADEDRTAAVRLDAIVAPYVEAMAQALAATRAVYGEFTKLAHSTQKTARDLQPLGTAMLGIGAGFAAAGGLAVKAAIDYESAFGGVRKTVDATEEQFRELSEGIREMSRSMPASAVEIANVAEAAGQLGVSRSAILPFTRTMVELGETTNLTADQAATAMARIANIMQIPQSEIERLGSTLVDLGNNGASTEAEILEMATRIAGAGKQIGLTSADVLAFANALSSIGIDAEAGGSAISRVMIEIQKAVMSGGAALDVFSATAGMSAADFQTAFGTEPAAAIVTFIEGLRRVQDEGGNVNAILEELGLTDIRVGNALRAASGAGDLFRESLSLAAKAFEENLALQEEYEKRQQTTAAQLAILRNNIEDLAISFGTALLPAIRIVAEILGDLVDGFRAMPAPMQTMVAAGSVLVGVVTLLGGGFLFLLPRIRATQAALATLAVEAPVVAGALRTITIATGAIGAALTVATAAYALFARNQDDAADSVNHMTEAFEAFARGQTDVARRLVLQDLAEKDALGTLESLGITAEAVTDILTTHQDGTEANVAAIKAWDEALADAVSSGQLTEEQAGDLAKTVFKLGNDFANTAGETGDVDSAMAAFGGTAGETGGALGGVTSELDKLNDALDEYLGKVLGTQQTEDAFRESLTDVATQLRDNTEEFGRAGASLDGMSEAAISNRDAMGQAVQRAADWVKSMIEQEASQEEIGRGLAQMAADLQATAVEMGASAEEARTYANMILGIPTSADTKITINTGEAIQSLDQVLAKLNEVSAISEFIGPIVASLVGGAPPQFSGAPVTPRAAAPRAVSGTSVADQAEDYLRALHEQEQERKRMEEAVNAYLRALYQHRMEIEDNMYRFDAMSKDRYLQILEERLAGLEKYSDAWAQVMNQIRQVREEALGAELEVIQAYESGRLFQKAWDALAGQRMLTSAPTSGSTTIYNTSNFAPTLNAYGSDAMEATTTNNQKLRDLAAVM